jgi:hypothetical protein
MSMDKLNRVIMEALGNASMCWSKRPEGSFDSEECQRLGERLAAQIRALMAADRFAAFAAAKAEWEKERSQECPATKGDLRAVADVMQELRTSMAALSASVAAQNRQQPAEPTFRIDICDPEYELPVYDAKGDLNVFEVRSLVGSAIGGYFCGSFGGSLQIGDGEPEALCPAAGWWAKPCNYGGKKLPEVSSEEAARLEAIRSASFFRGNGA